MQVVLQRVQRAAVTVERAVVGSCGAGLFALVGVGHASTAADAEWLARRTAQLRVFPDDAGLMNRSLADIGGGVLAISQFTLYADTSKGRRPSFVRAAPPEMGERLYLAYCNALEALGVPVGRGVFGAHMLIESVADGPVTVRLQRESGDG